MTAKVVKTEQQWRETLTPEQFHVCRQQGTERAFTGDYWNCSLPGTYRCVCCDAPLFSSEDKFDSGTGWPSFHSPASTEALMLKEDHSLFMRRTEVVCIICDSHLGHVFEDGPPPTGRRYCINSASLYLEKKNQR